ncbi:hypothetical protein GXP67_17980 [Rhodocytophaga rosea]|uniref:Uncharacterized protein n=1 Tax=Rhodocytophaga rosea TaxID=2704465 RepID=A0A6C0GK80_9BACT|nr:hypothetical protein [Rhodocytophaga rosea]QHT68395.1 hypothetical protein GXP67_17980 [Rhodocytophaga rosea]
MNLNVFFSLLVFLQILGLLICLIGFLYRQNQTKARLYLFVTHCLLVLLFFQWIGDLIGISTLYVANGSTINIFSKYQNSVPVAERINGDWILQEPSFQLQKAERDILFKNYQSLSPCFYQDGYCYFELGGFLHNSGGYALKVSEKTDQPLTFGFDHIKSISNIIGDWY